CEDSDLVRAALNDQSIRARILGVTLLGEAMREAPVRAEPHPTLGFALPSRHRLFLDRRDQQKSRSAAIVFQIGLLYQHLRHRFGFRELRNPKTGIDQSIDVGRNGSVIFDDIVGHPLSMPWA